MKRIIIFVLLVLHTVNLSAQEQNTEDTIALSDETQEESSLKFKIGGQYKNLFTYTATDRYSEYQYPPHNANEEKKLYADLNRVRISPELDYSDAFHLRIDFDNEAIFASYLKSKEFDLYWRPSGYNDLIDLQAERDYDNVYYRCKLHRAFAKLSLGDLTITAGRQQIRFGSARLWDPLDLLNPVMPTYVEGAEEQKGTDAVRVEYYLTDTAEIDLIVDGKRADNDKPLSTSNMRGNVLGRLKFTLGETDLAAVGGIISKRNLGGFDISSVLFDGMLRGSAIYSKPEKREFGRDFVQTSVGYEYNFRSGIYFLTEYFYNQNGLNYNEELKYEYEASLVTGINKNNYYKLANQLLTYNQHYAGMAFGYNIATLLRAEIFTIYDFQGRGVFISPSLKFNILENADLACGVMTGYLFDRGSRVSDFDYLDKYGFSYASFVWYF